MKKELTLKDVKDMLHNVLKWNKISGNLPTDLSLNQTYYDLTEAEFYGNNEFLQGVESYNDEMILDGIGDLTFTGFFWAATDGMNDNILAGLYHHARSCVEFGGANYEDILILMKRYLREKESYFFVKELICFMMVSSEKYDIVGSFNEICDSNLSKYIHKDLVESGKIDLEKEIKYIVDKGRYESVSYKQVDDYYILLAKKDNEDGVTFANGKIVKPVSTFHEPSDLLQFVY